MTCLQEKIMMIIEYTKTLDNSNPGMKPARSGTRAVATDHASTPISRTLLYK